MNAALSACALARHRTALHLMGLLLILANGLNGLGQTCSNSICGPYSASMYGCLSGTSSGTGCLNNNNVGFYTTSPANGSFSGSFEGIDSCNVSSSECEKKPPYDIDPNGGVGSYQFLQSLNTVVQAWDKTQGTGIFVSNKNGTTAVPQASSRPFAPQLGKHCGSPGGDVLAMYDYLDSRFVIAFKARWVDNNKANHYSFCVAVSSQDDLQGSNGVSNWSAYDFVLDNVLPTDSKAGNAYYAPDYAKLGTWNDGNFYVSWDLINPSGFQLYGSVICAVDRANMVAGNGANPMVCYVYWPAGQTKGAWNPGKVPTLIHTILPADIESSAAQPPAGRSPLFLAIVNPNNGKGGPCTSGPCTSNQLALWSWASYSGGQAPTFLTVNEYTPGCYDDSAPYNTVCVLEPGGYKVDSVGDRLMHRLVYRNFGITPAATASPMGEMLAAAHAIDDPTSGLTDIRYYLLRLTGSDSASVLVDGDMTSSSLNLFMPSLAFDKNGDLGVVYSTSANCSDSTCYPALYFDVVPYLRPPDNPTLVVQGTAENQERHGNWGDYFGAGLDPTDDLTFWGTGEYFDTNETSSLVTWQTRVVKM